MKNIKIDIRTEFIRLCDLLKLADLAQSGAAGKHLVAEGLVTVDGQVESRKTAKIRAGQIVACNDVHITVAAQALSSDNTLE
jgi:ribosome-associated protein